MAEEKQVVDVVYGNMKKAYAGSLGEEVSKD